MNIDCPLCIDHCRTDLGTGNVYTMCEQHMDYILSQAIYIKSTGKMHVPEKRLDVKMDNPNK